MTSVPTILYVDCRPDNGVERRRLEGMRRYAAARGWRVEALENGDCSPAVPTRSLVERAASLPPRCAVFAVNDGCAFIVADALRPCVMGGV